MVSRPHNGVSAQQKHVLLTAAHNEEQHIEKILQSVTSQTLLPERWVIVSDNSSDRTDEIVRSYSQRHQFIKFLRIDRPQGRSFGSKVKALHQGAKLLSGVTYAYIGNVDGDLSLPADYFETLISRFEQNPRLGIAGGFVHEEQGGEFRSRRTNSTWNVAHAGQLVRRECYDEIGGYTVLEHGGEDWYAQICARMKGWDVQAFPELHVYHHRQTGEGGPRLANWARLGRLDYDLGSYPLFEAVKCARRFRDKPYLLGGLTRFAAFVWSSISRRTRSVPPEFAAFLANEQKTRLLAAIRFRNAKRSAASNDGAAARVQFN
jgi:glycosyltransferase involved in cell wall biosynthesis